MYYHPSLIARPDSNYNHFPDPIESKSKLQLGYKALRLGEGIKQRLKEHGDEMRHIATAEDNRKRKVELIRQEIFQSENGLMDSSNSPEQYKERIRKSFKFGCKFERLRREKKSAKAEEAAANNKLIDRIIGVLGPHLVYNRLEAFTARQRESSKSTGGIKHSIEDSIHIASRKSPRFDEEAPFKPTQESTLIIGLE
ncbi:unnamed protein product [Clonostachys chloroleuca]|uniref:Uncharacterized protein n=1 Tax=Clonostachys chloroleuca TaxID=1926264 RepID=A0AA35PU08_9HYPO|nr:unnamed protein product [Clonostachys chloroleuca]